jgi:hypothetical protein
LGSSVSIRSNIVIDYGGSVLEYVNIASSMSLRAYASIGSKLSLIKGVALHAREAGLSSVDMFGLGSSTSIRRSIRF